MIVGIGDSAVMNHEEVSRLITLALLFWIGSGLNAIRAVLRAFWLKSNNLDLHGNPKDTN